MTTHTMKLTPAPFATIASGKKTIESRLNDEKRRQIRAGDAIIFTNTEDGMQTIKVRVIGLLRYDTFADMFANNDPGKFGGTNVEQLTTQIYEYYSPNDEAKYGVVGIELTLD